MNFITSLFKFRKKPFWYFFGKDYINFLNVENRLLARVSSLGAGVSVCSSTWVSLGS